MRNTRLFLTTAAAIALAACAQRQVEVMTGDVVLDSRWTATLAATTTTRDTAAITGAPTVTLGGRGTMMPGSTSNETRAMISLFGATPGSSHAWHVHLGTCGNDRGIVGSPELYQPVAASSEGRGDVIVTLPFTTPNAGEFYIDVHSTGSSASPVIACGALGATTGSR
ncbi:MAG: hypothetical protein ACT4PJ_02440 [Gemmatimonadaceae bacterium]